MCGWLFALLSLPRKASGRRAFFTLKFFPMLSYAIPTGQELAAQARLLILSDLEVYDSIDALAKKTGTNAFKLKLCFKQQYGESIFQFSRRVRMEEASRLLENTNYTLQTIALLVGYSEGNNFQISFKQQVGCTPGEWRKRNGRD